MNCEAPYFILHTSYFIIHQPQHFLHGGRQADGQGAADNAVADVQLDQVRNLKQRREVLVIQPMAGVDLQAQRSGPGRALAINRSSSAWRRGSSANSPGEGAGVQLDELAAHLRRRLDLGRIGRDEHAHLDAGVVEFHPCLGQRAQVAGHVQAALGGNIQPPSGTRHVMSGPSFSAIVTISAALAISRFSRVRITSRSFHTSRSWIWRRSSRRCAVMHMRRGLAGNRRSHRVRFAKTAPAIPRLPQGRHMIDIHAQLQHTPAL